MGGEEPIFQKVGDRATENARLWGRILEQCAAMRPCNTTSSIASSTYRRLVRRLRPHNCEAHLTPLVGMIFVKWECSCTWIVLQASIWQAVLRKSAQLTSSNAYLFGHSVANSAQSKAVIVRFQSYAPTLRCRYVATTRRQSVRLS